MSFACPFPPEEIYQKSSNGFFIANYTIADYVIILIVGIFFLAITSEFYVAYSNVPILPPNANITVTRSETLFFNIVDNKYTPCRYTIQYDIQLFSNAPTEIKVTDRLLPNLIGFIGGKNVSFGGNAPGSVDSNYDGTSGILTLTMHDTGYYNQNGEDLNPYSSCLFSVAATFTVNDQLLPQQRIRPVSENIETPIWKCNPFTLKGDTDAEVTVSNLNLENTNDIEEVSVDFLTSFKTGSWNWFTGLEVYKSGMLKFLDGKANPGELILAGPQAEWVIPSGEFTSDGNFTASFHTSMLDSINADQLFTTYLKVMYPNYHFDPCIVGMPNVEGATLSFVDRGITYWYDSRWIS